MLHAPALKPSYDAIIVGARCAGAATAMLLARHGFSVLALDRQRYGADTLSTHALMRPAVTQLARWGLLQRLIDAGTPVITRTTFHYGDAEIMVPIRPEPGIPGLIAPRRTLLDRVLVDAARAAGATVIHDTPVHRLVFDDDRRVRGVVVSDAAGRMREIYAGIVVGADGIGSLVARQVEAATLVQGSASVAHIYGYAPHPETSGYHWHFAAGVGAAAMGGGVIPTNDGLACVVASVPSAAFDAGFRADLAAGRRNVLNRLVPGLGDVPLAGGERLKAFRGMRGWLRQAHGPGWVLVGDAGFFRDPLTSHGISDALRDAEVAATAIVSGRRSAFAAFQAERDRIALPILRATDDIGAFDCPLAALPERHKRFSEAMKAEMAVLAGRAARERKREAALV